MRIEITDGVIPAAEIAQEIKAGADGAVCVFDGIVRDHSRGRKTLHLDYEAYREMALEQMRGLATEAVTKFGVRDVALVHRLGRLVVGETSVLIVVASAHRGAAFEACRWLIDTLKKTVPIWKKEQFVDGAVWADGEAFPEGVGLPGDVVFSENSGLAAVVGLGRESGRPLDEAHVPEAGHGAPGSLIAGSLTYGSSTPGSLTRGSSTPDSSTPDSSTLGSSTSGSLVKGNVEAGE
jgi:molybdopterin synthase catalytic subunit